MAEQPQNRRLLIGGRGTLSFFWAIVLACLLSVFLSIFAVIAFTELTGASAIVKSWLTISGPSLNYMAESSAWRWEQEGAVSCREAMMRMERDTKLEVWLLDSSRVVLGGKPIDATLNTPLDSANKGGHYTNFFHLTVASRFTLPSGKSYLFVARDANGVLGYAFHPMRGILFFGTIALIALLLARNIARPVLMLRSAVHQVAEGDLEVRVGSQLGRRRDELGELARDFDRMAERISLLLLAQKRLLGDISHELRSPLARLRVALELARAKAGEEAQRSLGRIEQEAERLNELIGQLLTLARLETDEGALHDFVPMSLSKLVQQVAEDVDFEVHNQNRHVVYKGDENCSLVGNGELLRSAVENIIRNAARYTEAGTTVVVTCRYEGESVLFQVRDRGPGVPAEALPRLFEPFYRVGEDRSRSTGGTGLGLAITERAVRLHRGTVLAENHPEGGLLVTVRIPVSSYAKT